LEHKIGDARLPPVSLHREGNGQHVLAARFNFDPVLPGPIPLGPAAEGKHHRRGGNTSAARQRLRFDTTLVGPNANPIEPPRIRLDKIHIGAARGKRAVVAQRPADSGDIHSLKPLHGHDRMRHTGVHASETKRLVRRRQR